MRSWRDDLTVVVGFYSRLPVPPIRHGINLAEAVWIVPIASLVIALPAALGLGIAASLGAPPLFTAIVAVAAGLIATGGLHEDGFADCFDGFWGGHTHPRRLEIMRDSRLGTYGVLALMMAVLAKVALVEAALAEGTGAAMCIVLAGAVAGRTVALYPWVGLPHAREDGIARTIGRPRGSVFRTALVLGILVTAALTIWQTIFGFVVAGIVSAVVAIGAARLAERKIGGHTGDVIGAAVVAGELAYLATIIIWLGA
ncbi:adenosylcobinamide-GDP ribazoletransferase [Acuticoccus sp. M5D2P5]|uniref:adenosylcobinamide-GDP ribazoletransferase n=1 Tax=Acuticoccus kalidii TaxID=2910977 RepID=UPI001F3382F8|nr:adenosylcobinamide-GDP ribazoletransferase [Acuticoccus kalidii]MCF3935619.1 adenosylcobinamide-GDP ribazoletransferase [Acuticoccus kalidii]